MILQILAVRQCWDDLTQGDPEEKIREVQSGKSGVNPNSPLGRSIVQHQKERIAESERQRKAKD